MRRHLQVLHPLDGPRLTVFSFPQHWWFGAQRCQLPQLMPVDLWPFSMHKVQGAKTLESTDQGLTQASYVYTVVA
jgi:hypothetical protein